PIVRAREIAYTRAYTIRVANKEGWDIASALNEMVTDDPMEAALRERLTFARQSAKNKRRRTDSIFSGNTYSRVQPQWGTYTQLPHPIRKLLMDQGNIYPY
ncbi:17300_t:CDS:1, partial [Racocetra persica]